MSAKASRSKSPHPASPEQQALLKAELKWRWLVAAAVLAIGCTAGALFQSPAPDPDTPPQGTSWWLYPIERNAWLRVPNAPALPRSSATLLVSCGPCDKPHVWVSAPPGRILRSDDAGKSWRAVNTAQHSPGVLLQWRVLDEQHAWGITDSRELIHTADGGQTWTAENILDEPRMLATSGGQLFVLGMRSIWTWDTRAWRNVAGQASAWLSSRQAYDSSGRILDLFAVSPDGTRFLLPSFQSMAVLDRRNANKLEPLSSSTAPPTELNTTLFDETPGSIILAGSKGLMSWSPRDGQQVLDPVSRGPMFDVSMDGGGWAAGAAGQLLRRQSAGQWGPVSTFPSKGGALTQVHFLNHGQTGWLLEEPTGSNHGEGATLWRTEDAGQSWQRSLVVAESFTAGARDAQGQLWLATSLGTLLKSTDGGDTWTVEARTGYALKNLWFSENGATGYVRTEGSAIYQFNPRAPATLTPEVTGSTLLQPLEQETACGAFKCYAPVLADGQGWAHTKDGKLLYKSIAGEWTPSDLGEDTFIVSTLGGSNGRGWAFGHNRALFKTTNGGRSWVRVDYAVHPAPWYFAAWPIILILGALGFWTTQFPKRRTSVTELLITDRPLERISQDVLGLHRIAVGLSRFIRNTATQPSLTIAVTGEWGSGKSSLLSLLAADLRRYRFKPVVFNAWHHEQEEDPVASLYNCIIESGVPSLPSREAILFRLRLLFRKGSRHPALIALSLSLLAGGSGYLISAKDRLPDPVNALEASATWIQEMLHLESAAPPQASPPPAPPAPEPTTDKAARWAAILSYILGLAGVLRTLLGRLRAFGVDPAKVINSLRDEAGLGAYKAQVGFHARFAQDFADVTRALAPWRMVIQVDDLDRCQPKNAMKLLDAINFLVSSGECFVILATSKRILEEYVTLAFDEVADSLKKAQVQNPRDTRTFAEHYLEKLINIEVRVPIMTGEVAERLLAPSSLTELSPQERKAQEELETAERYQEAAQIASRWGAVFQATVALVLLFLSGYVVGQWLAPGEASRAPGASVQVARTAPSSTAPTGTGEETPPPAGKESPGIETLAAETPAETTGNVPAATSKQLEALWALPSPPSQSPWLALVFLVCSGLVLVILSVPRGVEIDDSPQFEQALRAWSKPLTQSLSTPRSMKRFVNQVRLYAMRQRTVSEELPGLTEECIAAWLKPFRARKPLKACLHEAVAACRRWLRRKEGTPSGPGEDQELPDPWLVTLTALAEMHPSFRWTEQSLGVLLKKAVLPKDLQGAEEVQDAFTKSSLSGLPHASKAATSFLAMAMTLRSTGERASDEAPHPTEEPPPASPPVTNTPTPKKKHHRK